MQPKKHYQKPIVETVEFIVERGFANSPTQLPSLDGWEGWTRSLDEYTLEARSEE